MSEALEIKWHKSVKKVIEDIGVNDKTGLYFAQRARAYMIPFCPFRTGMLSETNAKAEVGRVVYDVPYAKAFYLGDRKPRTIAHPKATDHWDQAMLAEKRDALLNDIKSFMRKNGEIA
jgi:hypothetical protein